MCFLIDVLFNSSQPGHFLAVEEGCKSTCFSSKKGMLPPSKLSAIHEDIFEWIDTFGKPSISTVKTLETENKNLKDEYDLLQSDLSHLKKINLTLNNETSTLKKELSILHSLPEKLRAKDSNIVELRATNKKLKSELATLEYRFSNTQQLFRNSQRQLNEASNALEELKRRLKTQENENKHLLTTCEDLQQRYGTHFFGLRGGVQQPFFEVTACRQRAVLI